MKTPLLGYESGTMIAGRYEVKNCLGVGAMGVVLRVADHKLKGEEVALKLLHPHLSITETSLERFQNEVLLARQLIDCHIVRIYEFGTASSEQNYITMELVEGVCLGELVERTEKKGLPFEEALVILRQVAQALAHAHSLDIIHRDIKPQNILVSHEGVVKLSDFGTARLIGTEHNLTQTGDTVGTPYYMSPEQIRGAEVDRSCDVYAFGITAYEVCTGRRPFEDEVYLNLLMKQLNDPLPEIILADGSAAPEWFSCLLQACTEKEVEDRIQSFDQIIQELDDRSTTDEKQQQDAVVRLWNRTEQQDRLTQEARRRSRRIHVSLLLSLITLALLFVLPRISGSAYMRLAVPTILIGEYLSTPLRDSLFRFMSIPTFEQSEDIFWLLGAANRRDRMRYLLIARIRAGADLEKLSKFGDHPLFVASQYGDPRIIEEMLASGVNPNAHGLNRRTALMFSREDDRGSRITKMLLSAGADPMAIDKDGNTAAHFMTLHRNFNALELILEQIPHGRADVRNPAGFTPLHSLLRVTAHTVENIQILKARNAAESRIERRRKDLTAAENTLKVLLAYGFHGDSLFPDGTTPIEFVRENQIPGFEQLLLDATQKPAEQVFESPK